jgi:hypothetical protein
MSDYLTQDQFAAELKKRGIKLSRERIRKMRGAGKLEFIKIGWKSVYIPRSEIQRLTQMRRSA